ncbi:MAG: hypothetical protein HRT72_05460 [Flavobacteriales bacterium]|nr:hypothetical protein [Flavobacteriales bacterium]
MQKSMLANAIAYLFHPLYMPTVGSLLLIYLAPYFSIFIAPPVAQIITATLLFLTLVCPVVVTIFILRGRNNDTLHLQSVEGRRLPLVYTLLFYTIACSVLKSIPGVPIMVYLFTLGCTFTVLIAFIISFKWKISTHMMGIGGVIGMLIAISYILMQSLEMLILGAVLIAGFVGYSRLNLEAHSPSQVLSGFVVGVASQLILFL